MDALSCRIECMRVAYYAELTRITAHRSRTVTALLMTHGQVGGSDGIPVHGARSFIAEACGREYVSYPSLTEAASDPDGALVLCGDYGGTVFVTAPARLVGCDVGALRTLVSDLDAVTWMSGDLTSASVALERHPVGTGVVGGMGGGVVIDGVWVHPTDVPEEIHAQVREVVSGQRARVDVVILRRLRECELTRRNEWKAGCPDYPSCLELVCDCDCDVLPPAVPFGE
jgi:hypothetical protein